MKYEKPEMEVINLEVRECVITTSVFVEDETIPESGTVITPPTGGF